MTTSEETKGAKNGNATANSTSKKDKTASQVQPLHLGKLAFIFCTSVTLIFMQAQFWTVDILTAQDTATKYIIPCETSYINGTSIVPDGTSQHCERIVMDNLLMEDEVDTLLSIAKKAFSFSNKMTGRTVFNFQSGMVQQDSGFVNITDLPDGRKVLTAKDREVIRKINQKLLTTLSKEYEIPSRLLRLSEPSYFSRITPWPTMNLDKADGLLSYMDSNGHPQSWHYAAIVHLGTHGEDFSGGRLVLIESQLYRLVEAKKGRVIFFKSGPDTRQYFEKLLQGEHYTFHQSFVHPNATIVTQDI